MSIVDRLEQLDEYLNKARVSTYKQLLDETLSLDHIPEAIKQKIVYELLKKHGYI